MCAPNQCYCENGKPVKGGSRHCPPVPMIDLDVKATKFALNKPDTKRMTRIDPQAPAHTLAPRVVAVTKGVRKMAIVTHMVHMCEYKKCAVGWHWVMKFTKYSKLAGEETWMDLEGGKTQLGAWTWDPNRDYLNNW